MSTEKRIVAHRFDFALSFAGPDRLIARVLRSALKDEGFRVFLDEDYRHEMLGQDGIDYLTRVYSIDSKYCVVLLSPAYDKSMWTRIEREAIRARELRGEQGALIPVLLDGRMPEWLSLSRIYFDLSVERLMDLVRVLIQLPNLSPTVGSRYAEHVGKAMLKWGALESLMRSAVARFDQAPWSRYPSAHRNVERLVEKGVLEGRWIPEITKAAAFKDKLAQGWDMPDEVSIRSFTGRLDELMNELVHFTVAGRDGVGQHGCPSGEGDIQL